MPVRRALSPSEANWRLPGATVTEAATWATATVASPVAPSVVALIVAAPLPVARTSPDPFTLATAGSLEVHFRLSPATCWPCWSRTVAVKRAVSPRASKLTVWGETVTVRSGAGVTVLASTQARAMARAATRTPIGAWTRLLWGRPTARRRRDRERKADTTLLGSPGEWVRMPRGNGVTI